VQLVSWLLVIAVVNELASFMVERVWPISVGETAEEHDEALVCWVAEAPLVADRQKTRERVRTNMLRGAALVDGIHHEVGLRKNVEWNDPRGHCLTLLRTRALGPPTRGDGPGF